MSMNANAFVLKVKKLKENAVIPKRQTAGSAGYDLHACIAADFTIMPGDLVIIPTGLAMEIPKGYAGMIYTRSGLGIKHGIHVSNGVGVIDSDYRGEVHVGLHNNSRNEYTISPGERIAQIIVTEVTGPEIEEVDVLSETERGKDGLGSTGK